jgi:hypothetical protein|tara:strand:- start:222 stop:1082 length:861 start_codon:yes stop_codon:yes gene_type:complete
MANTTFKGTLRSEGGYSQIATADSTGVETTNTSIDSSGNASIGGTLDVTGNTTLANFNGMTSYFNSGVGTTMLGMNPQWNQNFGKAGATGVVANVDDVLTEPITALKLAIALEGVANQTAVASAAQASAIFGGTGVVGTDFAIAAGATSIGANQTVVRYTGSVGSSLALTASTTDLASDTHKSLIIFTNNVFAASAALTLQVHTNNELDASSFEAFVTGAGTGVLEREASTTDLHAKIILTASGAETTLLAGSYIYLEAANNTDSMAVKMMLRTSGGTIAVTTDNN